MMPYQHDGHGMMEYYSDEPENGIFEFNATKVSQRLSNHRRRARKHQVYNEKISIDDIYNLISNENFRCAYCHDPLDAKWEIDHVRALYSGGSNSISNLIVICRHCNRSKGHRNIDYLREKGEADRKRLEHHMEDWESELEHNYMSYNWNYNYRDPDEEEVYTNWEDENEEL